MHSARLFRFLMSLALPFCLASQAGAVNSDPDPDFDRLDGKGKSRRRVDVIEWEGNLEIHVYPGGGLRGLALKLDDRDKDRKVMVIGYRFDTQPQKQLIRRAILSVPFHPGFKVFRDPASGAEYDKIVISNSTLGKPLLAYKTEPEPAQLYPEGHPLNQTPEDKNPTAVAAAEAPESGDSGLKPFEVISPLREPETFVPAPDAGRKPAQAPRTVLETDLEQEGTIRPFKW
jgi:hypothetical protein